MRRFCCRGNCWFKSATNKRSSLSATRLFFVIQECIPVRDAYCPQQWPYLGGVYLVRGEGGVPGLGGVPAQGGVPAWGVYTDLGGIPGPGGVTCPGGIPGLGGVPAWGVNLSTLRECTWSGTHSCGQTHDL